MNAAQEGAHIPAGHVLISAPNQAGKQFISQVREQGILYYAIVNNNYGKKRLEAMGVSKIISVDTADERTWKAPDIPIKDVVLFEDSFNLTCRYIQICSAWKAERIYVVTRRDFTKQTYRALGATHLIFISNNDVSFLVKEFGPTTLPQLGKVNSHIDRNEEDSVRDGSFLQHKQAYVKE